MEKMFGKNHWHVSWELIVVKFHKICVSHVVTIVLSCYVRLGFEHGHYRF